MCYMSPFGARGTWGQEVQLLSTRRTTVNYHLNGVPAMRASHDQLQSSSSLAHSLSLNCSLVWYGMVAMIGIFRQWYLTSTPIDCIPSVLHRIGKRSHARWYCAMSFGSRLGSNIDTGFKVPTRGSDDCIMYPCRWWLQLGLPVSNHNSHM